MESTDGLPGETTEQTQLLGVVRSIRNRYRAKRALKGAAIAIAASWLVLAASAYAMSLFRYGDAVILTGRLISLLAIVALIAWFVVRPLLPRLDDEKVALYLEEHERSLQAAVITAVEMRRGAPDGVPRSPVLVDRLMHSALERAHKAGDGRTVDAGELRTNAGIFAAVAFTTLVLTMFGPSVLRTGLKLVATPWAAAAPVSIFGISVEPGNATVAKGGDELVSASLRNFQSDRVELLVRSADSTNWTRLPMMGDSTGKFAFRLFDIGAKTEYLVEANGVRSPTYTLDVSNLPYVKTIDLQYRFPSYTQMDPLDVDSTGDIAALEGTMVRVRIAPTVATQGGRLVTDAGDTLKLVPTSDGRLMAMLRVEKPGFYKVELQGPQGRMVTGSLDYTIDVLPDRPPTVHFTKPGRDTKVLSVDEVYTEAQAEDDYGVAKLDLVYSVNGDAERTVPLHEGTRVLKDISAGYTFMLEGLKLEPGDVVSYYARATDNNAVKGAQTASTDMYFLQVRPYENDYRQGQGGGGGGGGGGQPNDAGQLSQKERDIIAATFKTARDSSQTDKKALEENLATIRLSQQRLREQTNQLASRLVERGIAGSDSNWKRIADILPKAAAAMDTAEKQLTDNQPTNARGPEQRALKELQRAEAVFREIQVQTNQAGGGGGGGGNRTNAEDLADIFELQKDRLRNQYETVQRGQEQQQQQADNQVDETAEKLRQLAARQQQENERARAKADSLGRMGQAGASGGQSQRDLAQQAEDEARKLERLAREQQNQSLADAARRLQDAADQMRRAAANGKSGAGDGAQALQNLDDARRLLDQEKGGRSSRDLSDAMRQAQQLADQEKQVQSQVQQLGQQSQSSAGTGQGQQQQQQQQQQLRQSIAQQKGAMADEVKDLKSKLDRMALDNKRDQKEVSRAVESAADTLRGRKVEEKLRTTQQQARGAPADWLNSAEQIIGADIADLGQRLQQAQVAAQSGNGQRQQAQAADQARNLVRGLESLDERMRQRSEQNAEASQNGQGSRNQRGLRQGQTQGGQGQQTQRQQAQGQQGGQAQRGEQGQRNAQGQQNAQGQGQGQGQQGQQGQQGGQQGQSGQQGQGGQQQANGQRGQQGGGAGGQRQMAGTPNGGVPGGGGPPQAGAQNAGRLSADDAQQFSREAQQRLADAEALRQQLAKQGVPTTELDRAMENLRQLTNPRALEDTRTAKDLRARTIEGFKDFEFNLRRSLGGGDSTRVLQERSGDVPPAYKANVEEYYRAIAKGKKP